jgi:hypothetical protein
MVELVRRANNKLSSFGVDVPDAEEENSVEEEWVGMPEFSCEDLGAVKSIKVNFASVEDLQAFAVLTKQTITDKTKSIWYPRKDYIKPMDFVYHDES